MDTFTTCASLFLRLLNLFIFIMITLVLMVLRSPPILLNLKISVFFNWLRSIILSPKMTWIHMISRRLMRWKSTFTWLIANSKALLTRISAQNPANYFLRWIFLHLSMCYRNIWFLRDSFSIEVLGVIIHTLKIVTVWLSVRSVSLILCL
jgi:hypothetical protein